MSLAQAFRNSSKPITPVFSNVPFDILDLIKEKLNSTRIVPPPTPDTIYRVSSLVRMCPRQEVIRHRLKHEAVERIDHKLQRTFDIGSAVHWWLQNKWFGPWGTLVGIWKCSSCAKTFKGVMPMKCCTDQRDFVYEEFSLEDKNYGITGHIDGVLATPDLKALEIKTCNSMQYQMITSKRKDAMEAHKDQLQLYMYLTGIKSGIVLYFEKDQSMIFDFRYEYDQPRVDRILNTLQNTREAMRTGVLPPRELCPSKDCARAKQCPVRAECFE